MRRFSLILLLFFSIVFSQESSQKIDSLKKVLKKSIPPEGKASTYNRLSYEYLVSKKSFDSAYYYADIGYNYAVKENLKRKQVDLLFSKAAIYYNVGNYDKSLKNYLVALQIAEEENYTSIIPAITNNIGDLYMIKKDYKNAEKLFNKCLKVAQINKINNLEAMEYINLGEIYYYTEQYEKSLKFVNIGIEKYETIGDTLPLNYYTQARTLLALNEFEKAKSSSLIGIKKAIEKNNAEYIYKHSLLLSEIFSEFKNYKKALFYKDQALKYKDSINLKSEFDKIEKLKLNFKVEEQAASIENIKQKNRFLKTIYILIGIGVLLIILIIFRQLKIVRMTKTIHDIQYSLIKHELDKKKENSIKDKNSFDAAKEGDNELKE